MCARSEQFDAIIHVDRTRALEPLEVTSYWVDWRDAGDLSHRTVMQHKEINGQSDVT